MKTIGTIFIVIGVVSAVIQNVFFGYVDGDGVLHDSIFMPLAALSTTIGLILLLYSWMRFLLTKSKAQGESRRFKSK